MKFIQKLWLVAFGLCILTPASIADDVLNTGGIFNKGLYVCDGSGANCVRAKQVNNQGGITDNGDGSVLFVGGGGGGGSGTVSSGSPNYVAKYSPSSSTTVIPSTVLYDNGNVGIGTTNPGMLFDVFGSQRIINSGNLTVAGNVGISGAAATNNLGITAGVNSGIIVTGVGPIYAQINQASGTGSSTNVTVGNENIRSIGSAETVNIGPISITGAAVIHDANSNLFLKAGNSQTSSATENMDLMTNQLDGLIINSSQNVGIGTAMPSTLTPAFKQKLHVVGQAYTTSGFSTDGGYTQTGTSLNNFTGNVGINTANPGQNLDINGTIRSRGTNPHYFGDDNKADIESSATTTPDIIVKTNSVEVVRIANGGNVGIGSASPVAKLDIQNAVANGNPSVIINNTTSAAESSIGLKKQGVTKWNFGVAGATDDLFFYDGSGTRMTIKNGGNVGIGSTNPGMLVDIFGSMRVLNSGHITTEGVTATGATGTGKFVFDGTPTLVTPALGAATYTTLSGGSITDSALTSGRVTVASTAGLLADDADLTFSGDTLTATKIAATTFTGSITTVGISNGTTAITNSAAYTQSGSGVNAFTGNTGFTGNVGIGTTAAQAALSIMSGNVGIGTWAPIAAFQVVGTGNVGISTTNPGATLDVNGSIRSVLGASNGVGACWCTTPPKVLGYCTGALGTCSACNYNGSGC